MYVPALFKVDDFAKLAAFMRANSFATVITQHDGVPFASHLPVLLHTDGSGRGKLVSHMARANPQWQHFENGSEALVIFHGPHAYISPSWYETKPAVPTWNFTVVHAYGVPHVITDDTILSALLDETIRTYDKAAPDVLISAAGLKDTMMQAIVGFEIQIARVEGKFKLNQTRSTADMKGVIAALSDSGDAEERAVAAMMKTELARLAAAGGAP